MYNNNKNGSHGMILFLLLTIIGTISYGLVRTGQRLGTAMTNETVISNKNEGIIAVPEITISTSKLLGSDHQEQEEGIIETDSFITKSGEEQMNRSESIQTQSAGASNVVKPSDHKLKSPKEATPPSEYLAEKVIIAEIESPDENGICQPEHTKALEEQPEGGEIDSGGAVYVPGFGYLEPSGTIQVEAADSSGDWQKQIGTLN